jgi:hypothetical protein
MIPQDNFVIVAEFKKECLVALRDRLKRMTFPGKCGMADPKNEFVPFETYDTIHFARFVVLEDNTWNDRKVFGLPESEQPFHLCFMVDCDGDANMLLARLARERDSELRQIFDCCEGLNAGVDLLAWLTARRVKPIASYVNWVGRSVAQVHQEACLHRRLRDALPKIESTDPQTIFTNLKEQAKSCTLTAAPATPQWSIHKLLLILLPVVVAVVGLICLFLFPFKTIAALCILTLIFGALALVLRHHEQSDPIVCQPYEPLHVDKLRLGEDHDVTNQFTAMGSIKPGWFRLCTAWVILNAINWTARHIYTRGSLARIGTIHFAHWVFPDGRRPGFFCSNYDGGHEAYMDDFINKAGFGLNLAFSSSIGYPITNWLLLRGAWLEQDFKRFQRRHQIRTDVWYRAYPGLTARDLARNSRIRNGFEKTAMSDDEIRRWLAEI